MAGLTNDRSDLRIELLLEILDQAFNRKGWHGTTLRGALRGVSYADALWRPAPGRHNIWELTLHAAYWKYAVRRRLTDGIASSFDRKPSNWPAIPESANAASWKRDIVLLELEHRKLRDAVQMLDPGELGRLSPRGVWTLAEEIHGVAAHDLYHTGQIQLIKRLIR
jgi:DinB family protein